uniref:Uncharacterized protein n=1 Tax=Arundo donax TaxID=35708 RepID=A0A0A9B5E2_ARUDO
MFNTPKLRYRCTQQDGFFPHPFGRRISAAVLNHTNNGNQPSETTNNQAATTDAATPTSAPTDPRIMSLICNMRISAV